MRQFRGSVSAEQHATPVCVAASLDTPIISPRHPRLPSSGDQLTTVTSLVAPSDVTGTRRTVHGARHSWSRLRSLGSGHRAGGGDQPSVVCSLQPGHRGGETPIIVWTRQLRSAVGGGRTSGRTMGRWRSEQSESGRTMGRWRSERLAPVGQEVGTDSRAATVARRSSEPVGRRHISSRQSQLVTQCQVPKAGL